MDDLTHHHFDATVARQRLLARLDALRRRLKWHVAVTSVLRLLLLTLVLALLSFLLDRTFRLGLAVRVALLLPAVVFVAYRAWQWLAAPLLQPIDAVTLADTIDRAAGRPGDLAPRVATLLQLDPASPHNGSAAMAHAALESADAELRRVDWLTRLNESRLGLLEMSVGGVVFVAVALVAAFPQSSGLWARRWFAGSNDPWPQKTYLTVGGLTDDRRLLVPRGEPATLFVRVRAGSVEPEQVRVSRLPGSGPRVDATMNRFAPSDFRHELPPMNTPETIRVSGGDDEPEPIRVEPIDRPRVESLRLTSQHPTDLSPTTHDFGGDSTDSRFLAQTTLRLRVRVSVALDKFVTGESGVTVNKVNDREYELAWTHERPMHFRMDLTASGTGLSAETTPLTIGLLIDQPPRVSLAYSGVRQRITPQATLPLTIDARDDYGLRDAGLVAKTEWLDADQQRQTRATTRPVYGPQQPANEKEVQLRDQFSVADLHAPPGAIVSVGAVASDARYEGSQTARSKEAVFRLVTPEDLFKEILLRQQGERAKFRKATDQAAALAQELAALSPETAGGAARRHRELLRETSRVATSLVESITEMRLNTLGTPESYALMQRSVTDPLKALAGGPMAEQRDALDATAAGGTPDAAAATGRQERIVAQMNAILKQMAQWDSFVDVINQLNEIIRLQERAKQTTDGLKTKETDSAFDN
ncbi:MAG TPA: hypothetical protein VF595_14385 [Tepidisphaeraceae bacterium]|jgi:hypothetical protein